MHKIMFPKTVFSRDNIIEAHQHWTNFKKYVTTQSKYSTLASHNELCNACLATLSGRAYHWFQTIRHTITNTNDLQMTFLKKFNKWSNTERDLNCAWNKLTFNAKKHTVQELDLLAALIDATNAQIIDKFKECFPPEIAISIVQLYNSTVIQTKTNSFKLFIVTFSSTTINTK